VAATTREPSATLPAVLDGLDLVLCSSALRTARPPNWRSLVLRHARGSCSRMDFISAGPGALPKRLMLLDESDGTVLVIGHNPGLHELAIALAAPDLKPPGIDLGQVSDDCPRQLRDRGVLVGAQPFATPADRLHHRQVAGRQGLARKRLNPSPSSAPGGYCGLEALLASNGEGTDGPASRPFADFRVDGCARL
jgi:hypothetical protein